jgi:anti-sigma B factor antagonist
VLNFGLDSEAQGESALVTIRGDFDLQVAEQVSDELNRVESNRPRRLVIDLRRLSFMDSSGMAVVAAAHTRALDAGREFVLVRPLGGVMRAFQISRLADHITMVDDLSEVYP